MHTTDNDQTKLAPILRREPIAVEGSVLDYVGAHARHYLSRNDLKVVAWLAENQPRLEEIFRRVSETPCEDRRRLVEDHAGDLVSASVSLEDVIEFVSWGDSRQIRNDLISVVDGNDRADRNRTFHALRGANRFAQRRARYRVLLRQAPAEAPAPRSTTAGGRRS